MPVLQPALSFLSRMQVESSVELGRDDPTLAIPWSDPDSCLQYHNLKLEPSFLAKISEATVFPELREFLLRINSPESPFESAKCDVWSTSELQPEEKILGEPWKFAVYVDVLFTDSVARESFPDHERFLKTLAASLKSEPEILASIEFILRRCYDHRDERLREGLYFTTYVSGYGAGEPEARANCSASLARVSRSLLDASSRSMTRNSAL
jgi:hypothetical protein